MNTSQSCPVQTRLNDKALVFTTAQARVFVTEDIYKSISTDKRGYCAATMDERDKHPQQIRQSCCKHFSYIIVKQ